MIKKYVLFLLSLFLHINSYGQIATPKIYKTKIIEDLDYLYSSLEKAHYNLYAYTSKERFKKNYLDVRETISKDSLTILESTTIFQKVISAANNGHTEIDFPADSYREYASKGGTLFPLELAFENNKSLVRKNFSNNSTIEIGDEIISINKISIQNILDKIYPLLSAERKYFKHAKIEMYSFPRLYWQVYGQQNSFEIEIKKEKQVSKHIVKAVDLIEGYEMKRSDILNAKKTLFFKKNTAYLNPGDFSGDEKKYQKFIDSSFIKINDRNSKSLIIDIRNNKGGDNSFSDYLVSYIANKPFSWNSKFTIKTSEFLKDYTRKNSDTSSIYNQEILTHKNSEIYEYEFDKYEPQNKNKRFKGKVYVLINRQSHSQSTVTAAQIQDYNLATIVGEETAEYTTLYASQFQYDLPNTGITVKVSKGKIIRVNGKEKKEGVIPDIIIKDHLLDEEDEILNKLLKKLN